MLMIYIVISPMKNPMVVAKGSECPAVLEKNNECRIKKKWLFHRQSSIGKTEKKNCLFPERREKSVSYFHTSVSSLLGKWEFISISKTFDTFFSVGYLHPPNETKSFFEREKAYFFFLAGFFLLPCSYLLFSFQGIKQSMEIKTLPSTTFQRAVPDSYSRDFLMENSQTNASFFDEIVGITFFP